MVESLNALIAQTQRVHLIAIGNPGSGKSTLLNSLIGKVVFQSGVSNSIGLTPIYATFEQDDIIYVDTPGLNDCLNRQNSAEQIRMGLQLDGYYRIFFLVTLESGRIKPDDVSTMKLVLEAAPQITTSSYSIIVNKVSKSVADMYKNDPNKFTIFKTHLLQGLPAVTHRVFLNLKEARIDDMDNELATVSDDLRNFVRESPLMQVSKGKVSYIQWDQFEKTKKALADSLRELQDSKDKLIQAQKALKEALEAAEYRRRVEEETHKAAESRLKAEIDEKNRVIDTERATIQAFKIQQKLANQRWKIILSKKTNKVIDLENGSPEPGTHISQYTLHNRWNQQWFIESTGSDANTYKITSRQSGLVLDISGASTKGGAQLIQWPWHGGLNQQWVLEETVDGYFFIKSAGSNLVLDVVGASTADSAKIIQWEKHGGENQLWKIIDIYSE